MDIRKALASQSSAVMQYECIAMQVLWLNQCEIHYQRNQQAFNHILVLGYSLHPRALQCKCSGTVNQRTSVSVNPIQHPGDLVMLHAWQTCIMGMCILCRLAQSMVAW